jgi:signal transduction histidine kinase
MIPSIRVRLSASYLLLTLLTVGLVGALTVTMVSQQLHSEETQSLRAQAARIADEAFQHFLPFTRRGALNELAVSSAVLGGFRVRILSPTRALIADSGTEMEARRIALLSGSLADSVDRLRASGVDLTTEARRELDAAAQRLMELFSSEANLVTIRRERTVRAVPPSAGSEGLRFTVGLQPAGASVAAASAPATGGAASGGDSFTVTVPVGGAETPVGYVELTSHSTVSVAATAATRKAVLYAAVGALLVAVAFGFFMGQGMTAGLRALTVTAAEMARGDLSARSRVRGRDEIGTLAQQMNRMAAELETSFRDLAAERDTLRRFAADASHELRTPLTALKTFNELLRTAASADPKAREEFLAESQRQLDRLESITRTLLDLSRLDAGLVKPELTTCDAGELVAEAAHLWADSAARSGIVLRAEPPPAPLPLACDRPRMEIVLSNLLSNAVKFTPAGGEIRVGSEPTDGGASVTFWVSDTGPGIADADLAHVFDRFYRSPSAPGTGSGLGLAIVRSIAELHGGTATATARQGYGSTFRVAVPRNPA